MTTVKLHEAHVLDALGTAVIVTDLTGTVLRWNRAAEALYGWTAAEAVGQNVVELTPAPELQQRAAKIMAALAKGEPWTGIFHLQRRDGSTFLGRVTNRPLHDENGEVTGVVGLSEDLGEHDEGVRAWIDHHRLELALGAARMGTWEWDAETGAVIWDQQFEDIAGLEPGTFGGSIEAWLDLVHPEDRLRLVEEVERTDFERAGTFRLEYRILRPDGRVRWVETRGTTLNAVSGGITGTVGVTVDVTERKRAERDRERLVQQYRRLARTLQESLLPPTLPDIPGVVIAATYEPASDLEVGGDFYDLVNLDDGFGAFIGDVCGKGADAARLTALARYTLHVTAHQLHWPSDVLWVLNDTLLRDAARRPGGEDRLRQQCRFVTAVYSRITTVGDRLHVGLCRAGHDAPYVVRAGGYVEEVGSAGTLLGILDRPRLSTTETWLDPGDVLVLYTDGIVDPRNGGGKLDEDILPTLLRGLAGQSPDEIVGGVSESILRLRKVRHDDAALLAIQARPQARPQERPAGAPVRAR